MMTKVNFTRSQLLIYHLASFLGLVPFALKNNNLRPVGFVRKAYALILAGLSFLWTNHFAVRYHLQKINATSLYKCVSVLYFAVFIGVVVSTMLNYAFKSNQMIDIVSRIIAVKDELANLRIEDVHEKRRKIFYARIIATNCFVQLMKQAVFFINHNYDHDDGLKLVFMIGGIVLPLLHYNAILIFIETITCIGQLFESLNNRLQSTLRAEGVSEIHRDRSIAHQERAQDVITGPAAINLIPNDVQRIGKLHRELRCLAEATTDLFATLIVSAILLRFIRMILYSYATYSIVIMSSQALEAEKTITAFLLNFVIWMTTSFLELFLIANACSSVCRTGNATKVMLHRVWNEFFPEELRNEFFVFSVQLMQKPVAISAFGFFNLDYSFLFKILYTLLAYFIIMIQLGELQLNPSTK